MLEKEFWRLSGYGKIIKVDYQNCMFYKIGKLYDKPESCKKRWKPFLKKE